MIQILSVANANCTSHNTATGTTGTLWQTNFSNQFDNHIELKMMMIITRKEYQMKPTVAKFVLT